MSAPAQDPVIARIVFETAGVGAVVVRSTNGKVVAARTGVGVFTLTRDADAGVGAFDTTRDYVQLEGFGMGAVLPTVTTIAADVITITARSLAAGAGGVATETTGAQICAVVRRAQRLAT